MKSTLSILIGLVMMAGGLYGLSLDIGINGHYFGTGVTFGIGLSLLIAGIYVMRKKSSTEN